MRLGDLVIANNEWKISDTIKLVFQNGEVVTKTIKVYDAITDDLLKNLQVSSFSRYVVIINGRYAELSQ